MINHPSAPFWREGQAVRRIYGARHGVRGIVDEAFLDLTQETTDNLEAVAATLFRPRVDPGQAGYRLLPGDIQGSCGARRFDIFTSAATTPPIPCVSSRKKLKRPGADSTVSISRRQSTTI